MDRTTEECQRWHPGEASRWLSCLRPTRVWDETSAPDDYCVPCFIRTLADDGFVDAAGRLQRALCWLELLQHAAGAEGAFALRAERSQEALASAQCEALAYLVHGILTAVASGTVDIAPSQQSVGRCRKQSSMPTSLLPVLCQITSRAFDIHNTIVRWCKKSKSVQIASGHISPGAMTALETIYLVGVAHHCASLYGTWREMRTFLQFFVAVARSRENAGQPLASRRNRADAASAGGPSTAIETTALHDRIGSLCRDACDALLAYLDHELLLQSSRDRRTATEASTSATHALYAMRVLLQAMVPPTEPALLLACCTRLMRLASHRALRCGQPTDLANLLSILGILLQILIRALDKTQVGTEFGEWQHAALCPSWSDFLKRCMAQPESLELSLLALNVFRQTLQVLESRHNDAECARETLSSLSSSSEALGEAEALRLSSLADYVVECMCRDGAALDVCREPSLGAAHSEASEFVHNEAKDITGSLPPKKRSLCLESTTYGDTAPTRTDRLAWRLTTSDPSNLRLRECFRICAFLPRDEIIGRTSVLLVLACHHALRALGAKPAQGWDTQGHGAYPQRQSRFLGDIFMAMRKLITIVGIDGCEAHVEVVADLVSALVRDPSAREANHTRREQRALIEALANSVGAFELSPPPSENMKRFSRHLLSNLQCTSDSGQVRSLLCYIYECRAWRRLLRFVARICLVANESASLARAFIIEYLPGWIFLQMNLVRDAIGYNTERILDIHCVDGALRGMIPPSSTFDSVTDLRSEHTQHGDDYEPHRMQPDVVHANVWYWWLTQMWTILQPLSPGARECHRLVQIAGHPITLWYSFYHTSRLENKKATLQQGIDEFMDALMRYLQAPSGIRYGTLLPLICTDEALEQLLSATDSPTLVAALDQAFDLLATARALVAHPTDANHGASDLVLCRARIQLGELHQRASSIARFVLFVPAAAQRFDERFANGQPDLFDWLDSLLGESCLEPSSSPYRVIHGVRHAPTSVWTQNLIDLWVHWRGTRAPQNITSWLLKHIPSNEWVFVSKRQDDDPVSFAWRGRALVAAIDLSAEPMLHWRDVLMHALDVGDRTMFVHLADAYTSFGSRDTLSAVEHRALTQAMLRRGVLDWLYGPPDEPSASGRHSASALSTDGDMSLSCVINRAALLRVTNELLRCRLLEFERHPQTDTASGDVTCWGRIAAHLCEQAASDALGPAEVPTMLSVMEVLVQSVQADSSHTDSANKLGAYIVHMARAVAQWLRIAAWTNERVQSPLQELTLLGCLGFISVLGSVTNTQRGLVEHALRILATAATTKTSATDQAEPSWTFWLHLLWQAVPHSRKQFLALRVLRIFIRWRILTSPNADDLKLVYSLGCWLYMELLDAGDAVKPGQAPSLPETVTEAETLTRWFHHECACTYWTLQRSLESGIMNGVSCDDDRHQCATALALLAASADVPISAATSGQDEVSLRIPVGAWMKLVCLPVCPSVFALQSRDEKQSQPH
ncbi:hypothetical protein CCYA_CCYA16G4190 [Cyanidiococcus yangmingshanensis]|nr:hypothetical protein CCYA_CCYA16G4190 [Cyanidiococcus yangmingshanensis]